MPAATAASPRKASYSDVAPSDRPSPPPTTQFDTDSMDWKYSLPAHSAAAQQRFRAREGVHSSPSAGGKILFAWCPLIHWFLVVVFFLTSRAPNSLPCATILRKPDTQSSSSSGRRVQQIWIGWLIALRPRPVPQK